MSFSATITSGGGTPCFTWCDASSILSRCSVVSKKKFSFCHTWQYLTDFTFSKFWLVVLEQVKMQSSWRKTPTVWEALGKCQRKKKNLRNSNPAELPQCTGHRAGAGGDLGQVDPPTSSLQAMNEHFHALPGDCESHVVYTALDFVLSFQVGHIAGVFPIDGCDYISNAQVSHRGLASRSDLGKKGKAG